MPKSLSKIALATATVLLLSFAGIGLKGAVDWIDKPFPGFLMLDNGVVASAGLSRWPAVREGTMFQRRVVAIDGQAVASSAEVDAIVASRPEGSALRYRIVGDGTEMERRVETRRFVLSDALMIFGSYLLNGIFLGGVALALLVRGRSRSSSPAAAPFFLCAALWGLSGMDLYGPHLLFRAHALCEGLIFATAIQLALQYPRPFLPLEITRRLVWAAYGASTLLVIAYQLALYDPEGYVRVHLLATSLGGFGLLAIIGALLLRWSRSQGREPGGAPLGVLAAVACLTLLLPVVLTLPEVVTGGSAPQNLVAWTVFLFPATVGYAIRVGDQMPPPLEPGRW